MYKKKAWKIKQGKKGKERRALRDQKKELSLIPMKKIDQLFWKSRLKYQEKLEQYLKKKEELIE